MTAKLIGPAADALGDRLLSRSDLAAFCRAVAATSSARGAGEATLRRVLKLNRHRSVQAHARLALARMLYADADSFRDYDPSRSHHNQFARFTVPQVREAEALFVELDGKYANVADGPRTVRDAVGPLLNDLRTLVVGKVAPDIIGKDLDGHPMKLSDYRGRVILIEFWQSPAKPQPPRVWGRTAFLGRMDDKPFASLGVNIDPAGTADRAAPEATSRSWVDGPAGPIGRAWNVLDVPGRYYLIDATGVIRLKGQWLQFEGKRSTGVDMYEDCYPLEEAAAPYLREATAKK